MIRCVCPHCRTDYELEDSVAGRKLRCEVCERAFVWSAESQTAIPIDEPGAHHVSMPAAVSRQPRKTSSSLRPILILAVCLIVAGVGGVAAFKLLGSKGGDGATSPRAATSEPAPRKLPDGPRAERAPHYEAALARAKETGKDIVVFQRGSDWNRLAETLHKTVWATDEFAAELGDRFILTTVGRQEVVGGHAVQGECSAVYCGTTGLSNVAIGNPPPLRLASLVSDTASTPANDIASIETQNGTVFKKRSDGAWLAEGANPGQETLSLKMKTVRGGPVVRLDFPVDESLPGKGPGRASNGNFAISEIEATLDGKPVKLEAAWASAAEGNTWGAWQTIDGISDKGDNLWNAAGNHHQRRALLLVLATPVPAGGELVVRVVCKSQWGQHVPGCLRGAVLADTQTADDIRIVSAAQLEQSRNNTFSWWDRSICPRVALMDSNGCAVACENKPRLGLTPASLAARVRELRAVREKRDALWERAAKAQGSQKAELLRQGLDLLGFANWAGNDNCYKPVHEAIKAADPKDESGAVRWLGFSGDPKGGVPWAEPSCWKALDKKDPTDADFQEAIARVDRELKDPRNRILDHERIQRMMNAKYLIYKRWPGHQEERFDRMREIAAFDPLTFWGIGATGYIAMHKRGPVPMLTYGWGTNHVAAGTNVWNLTDTAYFLDHAGAYTIRLAYGGGKGALTVRRVALLDGSTVLAEARTAATLDAANRSAEVTLLFKDWRADRKTVVCVEAEAPEGRTDITGSFEIDPQLSAPRRTPAVATLDVEALYNRLGDELMAEAAKEKANLPRATSSTAMRAKLARHEIIRACGIDRVTETAGKQGGAAFLQALFNDVDWMEEFIGSDVADFGQSLENLRLLTVYGEGLDQLFHRRIATALALQWGSGNRYRLVDRLRHIQQAQREGLLHVSFENLNVREMRWAVPTYGTEKDYRFLLDDRQTTLGDYFGACWAIAYVDPNVFGDSVQTWEFAAPWTHHHGTGTGNRPFIAQRQVGGVCGTVSGYGSAAAQVHGVPSVTVGQPGHCAYIIRVGQEWPVGNSVTWPTSASAPGWEGTGYPTLHRLYEPVTQDRARYLAALRLTWLAHLQLDRARPRVRVLPALRYAVYRQGVGAGLPDFNALVPDTNGTCRTIDLARVRPSSSDNFGVVWVGKLEVAGTGSVRVATQSDDGSRILIDGQPVVAANCSKQEKELSLAPGQHALQVEFSQGGGALNLSVDFEGVLPAPSGDWSATFEQAIAAQPTNYVVWLDYIRTLENVRDVPAATWTDLGRRAARTFACGHEAGWALARRCLDKVLPGMKPDERMAALLACHQDLRQENWYKPEGYPFDGTLNWQADRIGDPDLAVDFFGKLLDLHHSEKASDNWIFGQVLNWGTSRFAGNRATSTNYIKALYAFFKSDEQTLDKGLMARTITDGIRKASDTGDLGSFRLWTAMAARLLPPVAPGDVHLNAQQAAAMPKFTPPPGELLSKDGLLQISSVSQFDRPLSYAQVLSGSAPGWFDTNNEEKPWAVVQLPGDAELGGVVLLNRYEYGPTQDEFIWAAPLKVSTSIDGKTWTDVASLPKPEGVMRVDFTGRRLQARYVRIERIPSDDKSKQPGRFHFRNFLVYGRKLY